MTAAGLIGRGPSKHCLQVWNSVGQDWRMVSPLNGKSKRSVQAGQVIGPEALSLALPESHPGNPGGALDLVGQRYGIAPDVQSVG